MRPVSTFVVNPVLPPQLEPLRALAMNFWWCWNAKAIALFAEVDTAAWENTRHNPVQMLSHVSQDRLAQLASDQHFVSRLNDINAAFNTYMTGRGWYRQEEGRRGKYIAYFCAEFGIHESFPVYSGGLGVLAGDHLKASSDLGLPLVAIGLLYQEGYFHQFLAQNGWQNERYTDLDFYDLPLEPVLGEHGKPVTIHVGLPEGICYARIWRAAVGRIPLYLLDTNIPENTSATLRSITDRLYGGNVETRVMQETLLGIGGMRVLQALGIDPAVIHINEGHAAFSMLERTRMNMERYALTFQESWVITQSSSVFTTHTPVPAGNEVFSFEIMERYLAKYIQTLGISWEDFCRMGSAGDIEPDIGFSMTILGLNGAFNRNGVSELHGQVARSMWQTVWPGISLEEIPIRGLTNGIHTATWVAPELANIYDTYLGASWRTEGHDAASWERVKNIPDAELWNVHCKRRARLVEGARKHILHNHDVSLTRDVTDRIDQVLDSDTLTIGFARRFASYKRADLLMRDIDRLVNLVLHTERPIQFILAGKAHPRDTQGKELLASVIQKSRKHGLQDRIIFLEDYEMDIARLMVRGCDVWLNTPRRPYEASGTSGMKAVLNGALHCSIMDGWWAEAYNGHNGFAIDNGEMSSNEEQDYADAQTLYDLLEHIIAPTFYTRGGDGVPSGWMELVKNSITSLAPQFSAERMVRQYASEMYFPGFDGFNKVSSDGAHVARSYIQFINNVRRLWPSVTVVNVGLSGEDNAHVGKRIDVQASIELAGLRPEDVIVQAVYGPIDGKGDILPIRTTTMSCSKSTGTVATYEGRYVCEESGLQGCTVRVMPSHEVLSNPVDAHTVTYAINIT